MLRCHQVLREECSSSPSYQVPPIPQEPKMSPGLKELHELLRVVREESLESSKRAELMLAQVIDQQQTFTDKVAGAASSPVFWQQPETPQVVPKSTMGGLSAGEMEKAPPCQEQPAPREQPKEEEPKEEEPKGDNTDVEAKPGAEAAKEIAEMQRSKSGRIIPPLDPTCHGRLRRIVNGRDFDMVMGFFIVLNVVMMFVELEKAAYEAAVALKLKEDRGYWTQGSPSGKDVLEGFEHFFNGVFFLELMFRFIADFCGSIKSVAVMFDTFIVMTSGVDYLFKFVLTGGGGANVNFLRMARLIKLVKLFRAFKAAAVFSELRILIKTLVTSMMALTWSVVLLSFIMLFSGLVMAQVTSTFILDEHADHALRVWVFERYGSGTRAFYTLFEATLSGGWPNYARDMIEGVSSMYALFWILYVLIVVFAVMRVVSALFLQNTLKMANADEELMHLEKMKKKEAYIVKLREFLKQSDGDGNGHMDEQELADILHREDIGSWLDAIGLETHEVMGLFHVLDDGHGEITHEELIAGMMKLSGGVRAIDSVLMQRDVKRVLKSLDGISRRIGG